MLASAAPAKFPIPFANGAGGAYIRVVPTPSQIAVTPGAASLTDGFPPLNMTPVAAGGVPPFGQDMNGLMNITTAAIQWLQAGGLPYYDAAFSVSIGGYPNGAMIRRADGAGFWVSQVDNNLTNPDAGGANWGTVLFAGGSQIVGQGLCKFVYSSVSTALLIPFQGNSVYVNGVYVPIPTAGLPLASSLQTDNTDYNVYAYNYTSNISGVANNGGGLFRVTVGSTTNLATGYPLTIASTIGASGLNGNWTVTVVDATHVDLQGSTFAAGYSSGGTLSGPILQGSTTAHVTASNGTEVMSGDVTKAWVGKFRLNGSGQFQQGAGKWFIRSAFNDAGWAMQGVITGGDVSFSSATYAEISSTARLLVLGLAGESFVAKATGSFSEAGANATPFLGVGLNSNTAITGIAGQTLVNTSTSITMLIGECASTLNEGLNTLYLLSKVGSTFTPFWKGGSSTGLVAHSVGSPN